jgi:hypothetical protein
MHACLIPNVCQEYIGNVNKNEIPFDDIEFKVNISIAHKEPFAAMN